MSRQELLIFVIFFSAVAVAAGRLTVPGHGLSWPGSYEAFAHIWVGAMLVLALQKNKLALVLLIALTVFETVMFFQR